MTRSAQMRQAVSLAAQLPEEPEDIRAVMAQLQRLVDEFLITAEDQPSRLSVVALRAESR